ncbi:MAG: tRNA uridine-5-carboxymethylaminomethyl(34) synthesis GTPase MnmE [Deltaproteobacteria bacterium GWA2_57_13]|nr:MAG: tRNA uridine-5-carboxymethylaminomethyl(34) synthesis GTPase MnmE [Deltaproteobacteria bacterium GWA2_57_13]OGQ50437.1 MAG: tRNA uridine-5-carboxymethylaminomethyl(34) synthesis GTPase MnmE [Deltaproteobacteria bacterium RIFCSPLOWO2_02_FULL_57_26]OGQ77146.1 MAG: tRNA uridine-5-carboxymethylaminomethyl(34) synthesis GTPase MnmE [Deltaproteobacteria bacterium RIFCSPLOWO2_12_FULL_57_22]
MYKEDTIAAIATPVGEGGVAIVRISGPEAEPITRQIFCRSRGKNGNLRSHTLHHGTIRDPETGVVLDEVLLALMRKPRSYTGEDVAEVHCHGGPYLVRQVLRLVLACGARPAEHGEFTKRAFLNGRLDLVQAEAVLDLIRARTEGGMRLALGQVRGELSKWVGELREELLDILVQVEAAIDFPEEEIELLQREELRGKVEALRQKIVAIIASYEWGKLFREGARVCIAGRSNVGKSSLFNALLGEKRVIVTPVPGTTRDVIEESINLGDLPVVLWDTAGIRATEDPVERIGVDLSLQRAAEAEAVLVVMDGSESVSPEDRSILDAVRGKKGLIVVNKSDLPLGLDLNWVSATAPEKSLIQVSARDGIGLDELKHALRELLLDAQTESPIVLTNVRHKAALGRAGTSLAAAVRALVDGFPSELVAVDLQAAKDGLEEIIGVVSSDDILERIFANFCLGK